jgi:hypothetical protein
MRWLSLGISAARVALTRRSRTHGILLVAGLRRVRHGRLQQSFVVPSRLDELFIELSEVVCIACISQKFPDCD